MTLLLTIFDSYFNKFIEHIINKIDFLHTKDDFINLWNDICNDICNDKLKDNECIFIITRGDHLGEKCKSRCKNDSKYCLKHYRVTDKPINIKNNSIISIKNNDNVDRSTLLENKYRELSIKKKYNIVEIEFIDKYTCLKNTKVVLNKDKHIIGYLDKDNIFIKGKNKDTEKISKMYHICYFIDDEIDE
jgi:hypothetical protein